MAESRLRTATARCPCCGYVTLHERSGYEICVLCWCEDDGQDDPHADEVWGGPNGDLSLTQARRNFQEHLTMYDRGRDTRVGGEDSDVEIQAKREIVRALGRLRGRPIADDAEGLWENIAANEGLLEAELQRKTREYEQQGDAEQSV